MLPEKQAERLNNLVRHPVSAYERFEGTTMRTAIRSLAVILASLPGLSSAIAQGQNGFYLKGDLGASVVQDTDLKEFFGESVKGTKIEFDPGMRFGIVSGFQVTEWFAPELEFGGNFNTISSAGPDSHVDATFSSMPFLLNVKFQLPNRSLITPYAGMGVGFSTLVLDAEYMQVGSTILEGAEADVVFSWQAFAGVRFSFDENMSLSLEYRYISADPARWEAEFTTNTDTDSVQFGRTQTHTVSLGFEFRF